MKFTVPGFLHNTVSSSYISGNITSILFSQIRNPEGRQERRALQTTCVDHKDIPTTDNIPPYYHCSYAMYQSIIEFNFILNLIVDYECEVDWNHLFIINQNPVRIYKYSNHDDYVSIRNIIIDSFDPDPKIR